MARNNGQIPRNRRVRKGHIGRIAGGIVCTVGVFLPSVVDANAHDAVPFDANEPSGSVSVTFRQMLRESGTHQFFEGNEGWSFRALGADGPVIATTDSQGTATIDVDISDAGTVSLYPVLENSPLENPQPTYILDAEGYQVNAECHIGDGERFLISDKRSLNLGGDEFGYRVSALSDGDQLDCSFFTEVASLPEEAKATPAVAEVENADIAAELADSDSAMQALQNDVARDDYWADWTVPYTLTKQLRYVDDYGNPQDTIAPPAGWKFDLRTHTGNYASCTTGSDGTCSGKLTVSGARGANFFLEEATVDPDGNKWIPYPKLFDGQRQCPYGYKPGSAWTYEETERECAGLGFTEKAHIDNYDTWLAPRGFKNWVVADCTGSRYFSDMENRYEYWDLSRAHWATTVNLPSKGNDRLPGSEAELKEKNGVMFLMHGPDASINCKFVNERPFTKLNITKKVFNPETGQTETPKQQWSFTPREGVAGRDNNTKRTDNNGQLTFDVKWSTVRIDEDPQEGYEVQDWSCKKGSKTIASGTGSQIAVDVVSDDVDCTIVNRPTTQKLTIVKKMVDYDGSSITDSRECSNFSFEVKNDVNGKLAKRTLDSSCRTTVDIAKGHALTLTENQVDGWDIMSELENPFECRYDNLNKELGNDHIGYSTKISNIQDDVTCTVYNKKREIKNSTIRIQKQLKKNGSNSYYPERNWQISLDSRDSVNSTWEIGTTDSNGWVQVNVDDPAPGYWMFTEFGDSTKTKFDSFSCNTGNRVQEGWNTNGWNDYIKGMQVEVTPGQDIECVFYNSELPPPKAGPVVIDKYWEVTGDSTYAGSYNYSQAKQKGFDVGLQLTVNGRQTPAQFGYSYDLTQLGGGYPYSHGLNDDLKIEETNFVLPPSCSLTSAVMESAPGYPNLNSSGWDHGGWWNVFNEGSNHFKLVNKVRCDATCPYQGFNVETDKANGTVTADGTSSYTVTAEVSGSNGDAQVRLTPTDLRLKVDGGTSAVTKTVNSSGRATWTITSTTSGINLGYKVEVVSGKSGYDKCGYSKDLSALFASEPQVCTAGNSSLTVSPSPTTVDSSVTVTGKPVDAKGNQFPSGTKVTLSGYSGYLNIGNATGTVGSDGTVKWSGTAIKQGSITLSMRVEGEAKDCKTATLAINAKPPATGKITINKQWWLNGKNQGYPLANSEIEITVNGVKVTPGQALTVEAGKDLVIKETVSKVPAGTYLSNKQIGPNNNSLKPLSDNGYTISGGVSANGQLTYVIVNDLKDEIVAPTKGSVKVSKQWQDTSGDALSGGSVEVTVAGTGYSQSKTIDGSDSVTFEDVPAGSVTVTEGSYTAPGGYTYASTTVGGKNGLSATATVTANNTTNVSIVNKAAKDAVEHSSTVYLKKYVCDAGQTSCQSDAKRADWSVNLQNVSGGSGATITNPGSKKTGGSGTGGATWSVKGVEGKTARVELSETLVGDTEFASLECHVDGGVAGGVADIKSATVSGGTAKVTFDVPVPPSGKNVDCYLYNRAKTTTPNPQLDVVYDMMWFITGGGDWGDGSYSDFDLQGRGWPVTLAPKYNSSSASSAYSSWGKWGDSKKFPKGQKLYLQEVQQSGSLPQGCSWDTSRGTTAHELVRDHSSSLESMHWLTLGANAPGHVSVVDNVPNRFVVINYVKCEQPAEKELTVTARKTWRIAGELKANGKTYTGDVDASTLAGVFDNKFKFAPRPTGSWPNADEIAWGATKSYQRGTNDANFANGFVLSETVVSASTLQAYGCSWNNTFDSKPSQFTLEGQNYTRAFNGDTGALYGATNTDYVKGVDHLSFSIVNSIKCTPPTIVPTCPYEGLSFKISPTSASIEPGKSVSVTVTASKTGGSFDGLSATLTVPAGFTLNKGATVDISGTGGVGQWSVTAPANLSPGDYAFSVTLSSSKEGFGECGITAKNGKLTYKVTEPSTGSVRITKQWVDESGKTIASPSNAKVIIWVGGDYAGGAGSVRDTITGNGTTTWNKIPAGSFYVTEQIDTYPKGYDKLSKVEWLVNGTVVATGTEAELDGVPTGGGTVDVTVRNYARAEAKTATVTVNKEWVDIDGVKVFSTAKNTGVAVTVGGVSCELGKPCEVPVGTELVVKETITKIPDDGYDFVKAVLDGKDLPEAGLSIGSLTAGSSKTVKISNYLRKHAENVTSTMYLKKYVCAQGETTCSTRADWQVGASLAAGGTGASVADLDIAKSTGATGNGATWKISGPKGSSAQVKLWEVAQGDKEFASLKCTDKTANKVVLDIVGGLMPTKTAPTKAFEVTAGNTIDCYLYNREPAPDAVDVTVTKTWQVEGGSVLGDYSNKNATINVIGGTFSKLGQSFEVKKGSAVTVTETGYDVPDGYEFVKLTIDGTSKNVGQAYSKTVNENATISVVNYVKRKSEGTASVKVTKDWVISGTGLFVDGTLYQAGTYASDSKVGQALGSNAKYVTLLNDGTYDYPWKELSWGTTAVFPSDSIKGAYWTEVDVASKLKTLGCSWDTSRGYTTIVKQGNQTGNFNRAEADAMAWFTPPSASGTTMVAYTNYIKCDTSTVTVTKSWVDADGVKDFSGSANKGVSVTVGGVSCELGKECKVPANQVLKVKESITALPDSDYEFVGATVGGSNLPASGTDIAALEPGAKKTVSIVNTVRKRSGPSKLDCTLSTVEAVPGRLFAGEKTKLVFTPRDSQGNVLYDSFTYKPSLVKADKPLYLNPDLTFARPPSVHDGPYSMDMLSLASQDALFGGTITDDASGVVCELEPVGVTWVPVQVQMEVEWKFRQADGTVVDLPAAKNQGELSEVPVSLGVIEGQKWTSRALLTRSSKPFSSDLDVVEWGKAYAVDRDAREYLFGDAIVMNVENKVDNAEGSTACRMESSVVASNNGVAVTDSPNFVVAEDARYPNNVRPLSLVVPVDTYTVVNTISCDGIQLDVDWFYRDGSGMETKLEVGTNQAILVGDETGVAQLAGQEWTVNPRLGRPGLGGQSVVLRDDIEWGRIEILDQDGERFQKNDPLRVGIDIPNLGVDATESRCTIESVRITDINGAGVTADDKYVLFSEGGVDVYDGTYVPHAATQVNLYSVANVLTCDDPEGFVSWNKIDGASGDLLGGSSWQITGIGESSDFGSITVNDCVGQDAADCKADDYDLDPVMGAFKVKLPVGTYQLVEVEAPLGFAKSDQVYSVTVNGDTSVVHPVDEQGEVVTDIENWRVEVSVTLPLTGEKSLLIILLGGLALIGIAIWSRRSAGKDTIRI